MATHRLASLRHRQHEFQIKLSAELHNRQPDPEAMQFFEQQKLRIARVIAEIESATPNPAPARMIDEDDEIEILRRASA